MQEFWVCDSCKSLVRKVDSKCYSCGRIRAPEAKSIDAGATGAVLTPGVDDEFQGQAWSLSASRRYKSVRWLAPGAATLVFVAVMLDVVNNLVGLGVYARALDLKRVEDYTSGTWIPRDIVAIDFQITLVEVAVTIGAAIACIALFAISVRNAPVLGAGTPPRSALAAVVWWFVPFYNLVRPFQIVSDVYARMAVPGSAATKIVGAWWACYLLSWFVRVIGGFIVDLLVGFWLALGWVPTIREAVGLAMALSALEAVFYVASGIFLVRVILELGDRQRVRARWIAAGAAAGLAPASTG